jgi:hypothetical protein
MGDEPFEGGSDETPVRRWRGAFTRVGLITAAGILYELIYQPALGVATPPSSSAGKTSGRRAGCGGSTRGGGEGGPAGGYTSASGWAKPQSRR